MRSALVFSMIVTLASCSALAGCAMNAADRPGDEGPTSALTDALSSAVSTDFTVTIRGARQGQFADRERGAKIPGISFHYNVRSPRDVASGQATGKRSHGVILLATPAGWVSPLLREALLTNELLEEVVFEFVQKTPSGVTVVRTVRLVGATIGAVTEATPLENVWFEFDTLEIDGVRFPVGEPSDAGQ